MLPAFKNKYDIVFISTFTDMNNIDKLLSTVVKSNNLLSVLFIVLNQTETKLSFPKSYFVDFVEIITTRISLSKARNLGIKYLFNYSINTDYVMFPDDDSTFDNQFFLKFKEIVGDGKCNFLIDVYGENSKELYMKNNLQDGIWVVKNKPKVAMSVNMLLNFDTIVNVGVFDEKMGVGARYGAGEDSDYFLRCVAYSGAFRYVKSMWNFHPKYELKHKESRLIDLMKKYKNYGRGEIYLHFKHRLYWDAVQLCFSALVGSFVALINFDFKLFLARFYAFFVRTSVILMLVLRISK